MANLLARRSHPSAAAFAAISVGKKYCIVRAIERWISRYGRLGISAGQTEHCDEEERPETKKGAQDLHAVSKVAMRANGGDQANHATPRRRLPPVRRSRGSQDQFGRAGFSMRKSDEMHRKNPLVWLLKMLTEFGAARSLKGMQSHVHHRHHHHYAYVSAGMDT